jgi:uncharacterized repeat protein (TIGR01451 family)
MPTTRSSSHDPSARGPDPRTRGLRGMVVGILALAVMAIAAPSALAATITGTAYEDFNDNGSRNSAPMVDSGVGGVTVTAYRSDGSQVAQTTTAADGTYTLNVPDGIGEVRVEFTDLPAGYQPARHGPNSGTTVQFVTGSASNVDVGVLQPFNYCQDNPQLAVCFMRRGAHTGENGDEASIRIVPDGTADQTTPLNPAVDADPPVPGEVTGALFSQTGSVFGAAQPTASPYLYSAAFTKRHADWGPAGAGAIYRTDIAQARAGQPNASPFFNVNDLPGDPAGSVQRGADQNGNGTDNWDNDRFAWDAVGNTGLGNLSSNLDGSELYTVGLATRELIQIPIPADGSSPDPGSVNRYTIPNPCTPADDARPFGTGFNVKDGLLYVGGVCSMASQGDNPPQTADDDLRVYVYTFDPSTGVFSADPVLDTPLEADRMCTNRAADPDFPAAACTAIGDWHPWTSDSTVGLADYPGGRYAQPMLADIEFVGDDLVLGIRDRAADQAGTASFFPDGEAGEAGTQSGYTLRACATAGGYQLENNGVCGGLTTSGPQNAPGWGPGGSRFYWPQHWNTLTPTGQPAQGGGHDYAGLGGTLSIPGYPELRLASGYGANECPPQGGGVPCPDANGPHTSAGVLYLSNTDGSRVKGFNLYSAANEGNTFGKSNGLGDLEALCEAAPIEIGNYVWLDPDRDGIQDAGETRLANVTVELLDAGGNVVATTTTDGNGQYYFNESNVPGAVQPNTAYTVRIPLDQPTVAPYWPTSPDTSAQLRDSDGITEGRYVVDRLTTGAAGHNDHTHDFGFHARTSNYTFTKTSTRQRVVVGNQLTYTLTAVNTGPDPALPGAIVRDTVPEQFDVVRVTAGTGATCTENDRLVRCTLPAMAVNERIEVQIRVRAIDPGGTVNEAFLDPPPGQPCCAPPPPEVPVRVVKPQLGLTKGVNKKTIRAGQKVTYTIRTRNPSNATLRNVRTCDDLPPGLVFVSATPKARLSKGQYCWTERRLGAGKSRTYKLTARAVTGIRPGKKVNRATATSPDAKRKRANRTIRVRAARATRPDAVTG